MYFKNLQKRFLFFCLVLIIYTLFFGAGHIYSQEFTSPSYKVLDPVMNAGGYGASASFKLFGVISQMAIGTSTSSSFGTNAGFLYFPFTSSPTVSATAGDAQVSLSWSTPTGLLGWTPSGYTVGQSTTSGGPYTYTSLFSLGNITSSTRSSLTNGTLYYFVIRVQDTFGNFIATSSQVSATPVAAAVVTPPSGGGGGGGGGGGIMPSGQTKVIIKGRAYPKATVTVFKDGTTVSTPVADDDGNFQVDLTVVGGIYTFSAYAIDKDNRRSLTTSFTANVPPGQTTTLSDIIIAPTIGSDKSEVKSGNDIKFFGFGYPKSDVNVVVNSEVTLIDKTQSDKLGFWSYTLNSKPLELGSHTSKSQIVAPDSIISPFSESVGFLVGDKDVVAGKVIGSPATGSACNKNGDLNNDKKVNIIDFSILLFFWEQKTPKNPCADINKDGIVNIFDFSIMLFWWSG
ncbi:MAG: Ig-like domain-containing protein [Candidatus Zambryskibacteria bacterium]|nr:Ig-like domain-containing protein [Candidatus Zambryskibacteria bacterium]